MMSPKDRLLPVACGQGAAPQVSFDQRLVDRQEGSAWQRIASMNELAKGRPLAKILR
jgi:hypothetical protein